ncbi:hypothetical protein [Prescottella equi]|uniref:hypothetical protein n=1 Tax=Rhodococcus hoagii TaxID=43767 RepID=UPI00111C07A9|nr:hypothetical protein [Prescottella equi]
MAEIVLGFRPGSLVALSKQSFADDIDVHPSEVIFRPRQGLVPDIVNDSVEIAFRKRSDGQHMPATLDFSVKVRTASTRVPFRWLMLIDKGVDGFQVRSS